jgi:hypothetical protein
MSQSTAVIILVSLGWLITVACFLLYVRHLRVKYSRGVVARLVNKAAESLCDASPIANSEQPIVRSGYVSSQNEPKKIYVHTPSEPEPIKIPRGWKKADGKTRHVTAGKVDTIHRCGDIHKDVPARHWGAAWVSADRDLDIIAYRVCKPSEKRHIISDKKMSESAKKTSKIKGFSAKAKKRGPARKTVTVKKS